MRVHCLLLSIGFGMTISGTYGQSLLSARGAALGAYGASVSDARSFESNPAGIVHMRDWEFTTSTYTGTASAGFVFQNLTIGKRLGKYAFAVAYTPGSLLEFVLPVTTVSRDSNSSSTLQQSIAYQENFLLAFAHRFTDDLSVGITGRRRTVKVNDTRFEFDSSFVPKIVPRTEDGSLLTLDAGATWQPLDQLTIGLVGRNLLYSSSDLPGDLQNYSLSRKRSAEISVEFKPAPSVALTAMATTNQSGAAGMEVKPLRNLALRGSIYVDNQELTIPHAFSLGAGWTYEFLEFDAAYLRFFGKGFHQNAGTLKNLDASKLYNLDLNPYTTDRVSLSLKAIFGNIREQLARIEGVEILGAVYPSSYQLFAYRPIGKVRVKNISDKPIQAKASFYLERYMDAPTETPAAYLLPGEEKEIPFNAVLNEQVRSVTALTVREGNVYVSATPVEEYDDRFQAKILIHGRNDWDGDVHSLRHFVTPDDPEVLRYTRDILVEFKDSLAGVPRELETFAKAKLLFNAFAGKLVYVGDPKQSSDYVQYPAETLTLKSGDCDDMTTCFASLLSSVGISTAFIDVVPPQSPEKSHIYMMFDTGLDPRFAGRLSENPKRFVIRPNASGTPTLWLPIETTVITKGFDTAWTTGAQEYLDDVEINLGLIKGWVTIIDVN
jgi:hypothetical protein